MHTQIYIGMGVLSADICLNAPNSFIHLLCEYYLYLCDDGACVFVFIIFFLWSLDRLHRFTATPFEQKWWRRSAISFIVFKFIMKKKNVAQRTKMAVVTLHCEVSISVNRLSIKYTMWMMLNLLCSWSWSYPYIQYKHKYQRNINCECEISVSKLATPLLAKHISIAYKLFAVVCILCLYFDNLKTIVSERPQCIWMGVNIDFIGLVSMKFMVHVYTRYIYIVDSWWPYHTQKWYAKSWSQFQQKKTYKHRILRAEKKSSVKIFWMCCSKISSFCLSSERIFSGHIAHVLAVDAVKHMHVVIDNNDKLHLMDVIFSASCYKAFASLLNWHFVYSFSTPRKVHSSRLPFTVFLFVYLVVSSYSSGVFFLHWNAFTNQSGRINFWLHSTQYSNQNWTSPSNNLLIHLWLWDITETKQCNTNWKP